MSGQIPLDPRSGRLVGDAFAGQARQALAFQRVHIERRTQL
ncbi:MAG: hypothetical protein SWC40_06450 [Thermodesulfobacteriota bacterium]|nr:hypothetical protein [Thermodesulfobacteriota bacterium]